jgi:hypothetical protein
LQNLPRELRDVIAPEQEGLRTAEIAVELLFDYRMGRTVRELGVGKFSPSSNSR